MQSHWSWLDGPSKSAPSTSEIPTSIRQVLSEPVNQVESLSQTLLRSLAPPISSTSKPPSAPPISAFLECDASLAYAVQQARVHQAKQRQIEELTTEILELDARLRQIVAFLAVGKDSLADIITAGSERLEGIERASKGAVPFDQLLGYASILANFTSAPPTLDPQQPDAVFSGAIRPPFPTEEMMRKGKMNEEPPLGSLGETREVGRPLSPSLIPQQQHVELAQAALAHGGPTQYTAYHTAPTQASGDLFDLDLNPDF